MLNGLSARECSEWRGEKFDLNKMATTLRHSTTSSGTLASRLRCEPPCQSARPPANRRAKCTAKLGARAGQKAGWRGGRVSPVGAGLGRVGAPTKGPQGPREEQFSLRILHWTLCTGHSAGLKVSLSVSALICGRSEELHSHCRLSHALRSKQWAAPHRLSLWRFLGPSQFRASGGPATRILVGPMGRNGANWSQLAARRPPLSLADSLECAAPLELQLEEICCKMWATTSRSGD